LERRTVSHVALAASGAAVAVALAILVVRVKAEAPAPDLQPGELARVEAQRAAPPAVPSNPPSLASLQRFPPPRRVASPAEVPAAEPAPQPPPNEPPPTAEVSSAPLGAAAEVGAEAGLVPAPEEAGPLQGVIGEAIRLYDGGEYESARTQAIQALEQDPANQRMLRIVTSTSCILGDVDQARAHYERLTLVGQRQMARRCSRYGVEL